MDNMIRVGMADLKACLAPNALTTLGLGSCVGIALYDSKNGVGGMAHIMLPDSKRFPKKENVAKYADSGIDCLISEMVKLGAVKSNLTAKIAGGAQMFAFKSNSNMLQIGESNVEATKANLKKHNIEILAEDTGLNFGRTIEFYTETGILLIKSVGKPDREI